jgi:hypothetical protein
MALDLNKYLDFLAPEPRYAGRLQNLGLIGPDDLEKARQQSLFQGLLGAGLTYLAMPKNQNYGTIAPYAARAGLAGLKAMQGPMDKLTEEALFNQKLDDYKFTLDQRKREEKARDLQSQLFTPTQTTTTIPQSNQLGTSAPIDASNPSGVMIAPNFRVPEKVTKTQYDLNQDVLTKLAGLDMNRAGQALSYQKGLTEIENEKLARQSIDAFVEKYPQFEYIQNQPTSDAMAFIRQATGPSASKIINDRYSYNVITNELKDLGISDELTADKGTFQKSGVAVNPINGDSYVINYDTRKAKEFVKIGGKDVPFEELRFDGKKPLRRNVGDLNVGQLNGGDMIKLTSNLIQQEESLKNLSQFMENNQLVKETGLPKYLDLIARDMKMLLNKGFTPKEVVQSINEGKFQQLIGQNRLAVVGSGTMTEFDAQRVILALGGDPASIVRNPQVAKKLLSDLLRSSYRQYQQLKSNYDIQLVSGNQVYGEKQNFNFSKSQIDSMSPNVALELGLRKFNEMTNTQIVELYLYDRQIFNQQMLSDDLSPEERARIAKIIMPK